MAETLEEKVNAGPQHTESKEEKKPVGVFNSVTNELSDLVNLGIGVAAPATGFALTGNAGVLATSAAFIAGTKGKKDSKIIRNESLSGAIFGAFAHYTLAPLRFLSNLGKAVYQGLLWPLPANIFYMSQDHFIKQKSPKGLYKKLKEDLPSVMKKAYKTVIPLNVASALLLPQQYMVGAIAVASYIFRRFVVKGKGEEYEDKRPYPVAALSVATKLISNPIKGFYEAVSAVGGGIRDVLYKAAPMPATPATAASPAH